MLTRKQFELLRFIHERMKQTAVAPSFAEMKEAVGLRSKSGVHRLVTGLEERGFIRRLPKRARAIEVIRMPEVSYGMGALHGFTACEPPFVLQLKTGGRVRFERAEDAEKIGAALRALGLIKGHRVKSRANEERPAA